MKGQGTVSVGLRKAREFAVDQQRWLVSHSLASLLGEREGANDPQMFFLLKKPPLFFSFLYGAFGKLREVSSKFVMPVRMSVRLSVHPSAWKKFGSRCTDFQEI